MFLKYLAPLYEPIKFIRNKFVKGQNTVGKVRVDVGRVKSYKNLAKSEAKRAKDKAKAAKGKAKDLKAKAAAKKAQWGPGGQQPQPAGAAAGGYGGGPPMGAGGYPGGAGAPTGAGGMAMQGGNPQGGYPPPGGGYGQPPGGGYGPPPGAGPQVAPGAGAGYPGPPGGGGPPGAVNGGESGIIVSGALWWKKHLCANCGQELDKTWDRCPYCSVQAVVAAPNKTQAIMMDYAGMGTGMQLLGWLVSISRGPQRGELFTLQPMTTVGTDPSCTVVLQDGYMSSRHCEIKAEGGIWVLRDLKSTNGTYVNDRRVEQHELVDNDFIKVGQSVLKFKSL
jgi:hypothetical protein